MFEVKTENRFWQHIISGLQVAALCLVQTYFCYKNENKNQNDSFRFIKTKTISYQKTK